MNIQNIINTSIPKDAPENTYKIGTKEWADWIVKSRDSQEYIVILFKDKAIWPIIKPYPFLTEHRRDIESGKASWFFIDDVIDLALPSPEEHMPKLAVEKISGAIRIPNEILDRYP